MPPVEPFPPGETMLGGCLAPCSTYGVLVVSSTLWETNKELGGVDLRIRHSITTVNTDFELDASGPNHIDFPSEFFEYTGILPGVYTVTATRDGYDLDEEKSELSFRIAEECCTKIELYWHKRLEGDLLAHIDHPILRHYNLQEQRLRDLGPDAPVMTYGDQCIDFPALLGILNRQSPEDNKDCTLLGVFLEMPFSAFRVIRDAFLVMDYAQSSTKLNVSPVNLDDFLGGMHDGQMPVIFLVPPAPGNYKQSRTSKEFFWYQEMNVCKRHVLFVFGAYDAISQEDYDQYIAGANSAAILRQLFRRYEEYLMPEELVAPSTLAAFEKEKKRREDLESLTKSKAASSAEEIDFNDI